ncbi:MAG TPA: hypothetical protein VJ023_08205 [Pyrinomonadaceae bacterium]|nr:hypothetical protein [Pyrinomonadaceae bacterium]
MSDETIFVPIKIRVLSLKSGIGIPTILTIDNGENGTAAVWDFTPLLKDNKLGPKEKLRGRRLEFRFSGVSSKLSALASTSEIDLIRVELKALGRKSSKAP